MKVFERGNMKIRYSSEIKEIGKIIKNLRKAKGLTQLQLSEFCCLSDSHIRNLENGTAHPSLDALVRISNALEIPLEKLIPNIGEDFSPTLSQIEILNGLTEKQQISFIEVLEDIKEKGGFINEK